MREIYDLVNREVVAEAPVTHLPAQLLPRVLRWLQYSRKNLFSPEEHILHASDNVVPADAEHTIQELNVELSSLEKRAIETLVRKLI